MAAAGAEGLVLGVAGHVEAVGVLVAVLVAVRRRVPERDLVALVDRAAAELGVLVAVRRKCAKAGNIRSASSTAPGTSSGSSISRSRWSGFSISARIVLVYVAFVESLPAAISSTKPAKISSSVSMSPSISAKTSVLSMSSVGSRGARRRAPCTSRTWAAGPR